MFSPKDRTVGFAFMLLGLMILWQSTRFSVATPLDSAGPGALPSGIAVGMILLGLVHLVGGWHAAGAARGSSFMSNVRRIYERYRRVAGVGAAGFFYAALLDFAGYLILTPILIGSVLYILDIRDVRRIVVTSTVMTTLLYSIFDIGLRVDLPMGVLETAAV